MRRLCTLLLAWAWLLGWGGGLCAAEFELTDGTTIYGEVSAFDENGVVFRLRSGGFSPRIPWGRFDQPTLKTLAADPKAREFAEPYIEIPPEARPRPQPRPVVLQEVPRVELPAGRPTLFSSFSRPIGLLILAALYLANLLAAYEIALFRNRPVAVVCGLSALLPLVGPLIFLASPTYVSPEATTEEALAAPPPPGPTPAVVPAGSPAAASRGSLGAVGVPPPMGGTGLRVAAPKEESAAAGRPQPKIYKRGDYTFNRRFIETQFSGFFRLVPSEAEKDLVLIIRTPKQEFLARRISRISATEMFIQPVQAGAKEVNVVIGEIAEIQVRHKDDLAR